MRLVVLAMSRCRPDTSAGLLKIIFDKPYGRRYRKGGRNENDYQEGGDAGTAPVAEPGR